MRHEHESGLSCLHAAAGLCPACAGDWDEDPAAYAEFGDHPAGIENWRRFREEMDAAARRRSEEEADDGAADDLPF